jgi:P4 family phage/plasmid primase-like protien
MYDKKSLALKAKKPTEILYAQDCKRFFICDNYNDFLKVILSKHETPRLYEYIFAKDPVNFFYDIEIKEHENNIEYNEYVNVISTIIDSTRSFFIKLGLLVKVIVLESHTTGNNENHKKSFHLIFKLSTKSNECIFLKNVLVCKTLAQYLFPKLSLKKIVDISVYREGCFRTIYSTKINESRAFVRSIFGDQDFNDIETFVQYNTSSNSKNLLDEKNLQLNTIDIVSKIETQPIPTIQVNDKHKMVIIKFLKNEYNYDANVIFSIELKPAFFVVALKDKYCKRITDFHQSNNQYIIIDTKSSRRKCHDEDCKNFVTQVVEYVNFSTDLQDIIVQFFNVEKLEQESFLVNQELNQVVATQFDDRQTNFNYDRTIQKFSSRGDPHLQSFLRGTTCAPGQCHITHNITNGNIISFQCSICGAKYPQEGMQLQLSPTTCPQLTHFWQNNGSVMINNNNYYSGEDNFACDVSLDISIFNNNRDLASLYNQILDGHKTAKISELLYQVDRNFVYSNENWYFFNGCIWEKDSESLTIVNRAIALSSDFETVKIFYERKNNKSEADISVIKNIKNLVIKLSKLALRKEIIEGAKFHYKNANFIKLLNCKKHIVPFTNGVFDLLTRQFRDTVKEDYINLTFGYDYSPKIRNLEVQEFIQHILPIKQVRDYVLKKMAECLNGDIPNTNFLMFIGDGANGKSQILNLMKLTMGQLAEKVEVTLLTRKRNNANEANTEKIKLMHKRFAYLSEPEDGEKINISLLKELTGSEEIVARGLYEGSQTFVMETKLFLACNELPEIKGEDTALWRRIKVVNFPSRFVDDPKEENEFKIDRSLPSRMREDITWRQTFINILIEYYFTDVIEPIEVKAKTNEYRQGNDVILEFVMQMCELNTNNRDLRIDVVTLWEAFLQWVTDEDLKINITNKQFKERIDKLTKYEYKKKIRINSNVTNGWIGIKLLE